MGNTGSSPSASGDGGVLTQAQTVFSGPAAIPKTLKERMKAMLQTGRCSDVRFNVTDKKGNVKTFDAHKVILAARCPYFAAMLYSQFKEAALPHVIEIAEMPHDLFANTLTFLYTGDFPGFHALSDSAMIDVLMIARLYDLQDLLQQCRSQIRQGVFAGQACAFLEATPHWLADDDEVWRLIEQSTLFALRSPGSETLSSERVLRLVSNPNLDISEFELWLFLLRWAQHQMTSSSSSSSSSAAGDRKSFSETTSRRGDFSLACLDRKDVMPTLMVSLRESLMSEAVSQKEARRKLLHPYLPHLRLGNLTASELADWVYPSGVLEPSEMLNLMMRAAAEDHKKRIATLGMRGVEPISVSRPIGFSSDDRVGYSHKVDPVNAMSNLVTSPLPLEILGGNSDGALFEDAITGHVYAWANPSSNRIVQRWDSLDTLLQRASLPPAAAAAAGGAEANPDLGPGGSTLIELHIAKQGTYVAALGGNLYFFASNMLHKCSIEERRGTQTARTADSRALQSGLNNHVCLYVDRPGKLYASYEKASCHMLAMIDPDTLEVQQEWRIPRPRANIFNAFVSGGAFYWQEFTSSALFRARLVLRTGQVEMGQPCPVPAGDPVMVTYAPKSNALLIWDRAAGGIVLQRWLRKP